MNTLGMVDINVISRMRLYNIARDCENWCENINCKHNPELHVFNTIRDKYFLRKGTTALETDRNLLCKDCVDIYYQNVKSFIDTKLWIFR